MIYQELKQAGLFKRLDQENLIYAGISGARIQQLNTDRGPLILKSTFRGDFEDRPGLYDSFLREYDFYMLENKVPVRIPHCLYGSKNQEGCHLVFEAYRPVDGSAWTPALLDQALDLLADLHTLDREAYRGLDLEDQVLVLEEGALEEAYQAWMDLIKSRDLDLNRQTIRDISLSMDGVVALLNAGDKVLCHGDFHRENLLQDDQGLYLCDWQQYKLGLGGEDVAFFLSRGQAEGLDIDQTWFIKTYVDHMRTRGHKTISSNQVRQVIEAKSLYLSFMEWPYYLGQADPSDIRAIYDKMVIAYKQIKEI